MFEPADRAAHVLGQVICRKRAYRKALAPQVHVYGRDARRARPETGCELCDRKKVVVNRGAGCGDGGSEGTQLGGVGRLEEDL